jgi:endonuclease-8
MPEGDTLHRTARTLAPVLVGKVIVRVASPLPALSRCALAGRRFESIEAVGKHLVMRFDDGRVLRSHMRMTGSWHLYKPGDRWRYAGHRARIVLEVEGAVAVCFDAPVVELTSAGAAAEALAGLGPDLLGETFDADEGRRRLRALGELAIGEAVMSQRAVAGIGNIFKSETLFATKVNPFALVRDLPDETLDLILKMARRLLKRSVASTSGRRQFRSPTRGDGHAVYMRRGRPCFTCGGAIAMRRQGAPPRSTYFCPRCQRVTSGAVGA